MLTEKSQPSSQRIIPETRYTSFPALSVYPRVGISLSASETDDRLYSNVLLYSYLLCNSEPVYWVGKKERLCRNVLPMYSHDIPYTPLDSWSKVPGTYQNEQPRRIRQCLENIVTYNGTMVLENTV